MSTDLVWRTIFVVGIIICAGSARAQSDTCPVFGNDQQSSVSLSREEKIFLNFEAPSQCRGTVTTWRYCHYTSTVGDDDDDDDDDDSGTYGAKFLVYRRSSPTSNDYLQVAGSVSSVMLSRNNVRSFRCRQLTVAQPFEIQENDIIAACVWDQGSVNPLYLVGDTNNANVQRLYQVDRSGYDDCRTSQLASVDTSRNDFRHRREFILHLYADIAVPTFCRVGNNPPASSPNTAVGSGTYLNTANQVNCATQNTITSWHYCYYNASVTSGQTYTMTVGVWRLDSSATTYQLISGSSRTITLVPVATLAKIFCVEESLNPADYVFVSQNDVIGVTLPNTNAIPVLSSASGSSLLRQSETVNTASLLTSGFTITLNSALHLYSNLEYVSVPTTVAPTMTTEAPSTTTAPLITPTGNTNGMNLLVTTDAEGVDRTATDSISTMTSTMTSTAIGGVDDREEREGFRSGDISAVIISIILVTSVLAVAVLILLYVQRRRKKSTSTGISNVAYDVPSMSVHISDKSKQLETKENEYDTITAVNYPTPSLSAAGHVNPVFTANEQIYQEIADAPPNQPMHSNFMTPSQDYHERLEEVIRGTTSRVDEDPYHNPATDERTIHMELKKMRIQSIPQSAIEIGEVLGSGQFGTVNQATWHIQLRGTHTPVQVAVKALKVGASATDRLKFLREMATMAQFRHPNVINLHGTTQRNGQRMIIVELLSKGDLREYLLTLRPDPGELVQPSMPRMLLDFSQQICLGMSYLSEKGFIHRDLAARNILLSDDNICKIADFGMSHELQDTDYYVSSGGKIPLKWTAPEAIFYKKYSTASDVWSYGCVLYEIWSLGKKPFHGISNVELLRKVQDGVRLAPPPGCPKRVYEVMILTWSDKARDRPSFRQMLLYLLENKSVVLDTPQEDMATHPQATVLGAPLDAGQEMYKELQNTYLA